MNVCTGSWSASANVAEATILNARFNPGTFGCSEPIPCCSLIRFGLIIPSAFLVTLSFLNRPQSSPPITCV